MRRGLLLLLILLGVVFSKSYGQDIHFSQYWMSPMQLSPAMTGAHSGEFRAGLNYRNQWFTFANTNFSKPTFVTYSFSFEYNFLRDKLDPDKFSAGILFFNDRAGDGALTTTSILASLAYHKTIDRYGRHSLGIGLQAGFVQKRVFINDLLFENQLDAGNIVFDRTRFNGEPGQFANGNNPDPIAYPDANIGILWTSDPLDRFRYYATFSVFHIARPVENFFDVGPNQDDNRLDQRYSINAGFEIDVSRKVSISPSFMFQTQAKAREFNMGAAAVIEVAPDINLFTGMWTRVDFETALDAIYPVVGMDFQNSGLRAGISYDVNVSDLKIGTNAHGAIELSLLYVHQARKWGRRIPGDHYCPQF